MNKIAFTKPIINTMSKAIAVAVSVAVIVTNTLGVLDFRSEISLLGIGLFSLAVINFEKE